MREFISRSTSITGSKHPINDDSQLALSSAGIFCVADGMGGYAGGNIASRVAVDVLEEYARSAEDECRKSNFLLEAFQAANFAIHEHSMKHPELMGMGTTCTAIHFARRERIATFVHIGDSRCYRLSGNDFVRITEDHSIPSASNRSKLILNRALGVEAHPEIDCFEQPYTEGEIYLLCTDGLSSFLKDEKIESILRKYQYQGPLDSCLQELIRMAKLEGSDDDITAVAIRT